MARSSFWQDWLVQVALDGWPMDGRDKACADWLGWAGDPSWAKTRGWPGHSLTQRWDGVCTHLVPAVTSFRGPPGCPLCTSHPGLP